MRFRTHWLYWTIIVMITWLFAWHDTFNMFYIWGILAVGWIIDWRIEDAKRRIQKVLDADTLFLRKDSDTVWTARVGEQVIGRYNCELERGYVHEYDTNQLSDWFTHVYDVALTSRLKVDEGE